MIPALPRIGPLTLQNPARGRSGAVQRVLQLGDTLHLEFSHAFSIEFGRKRNSDDDEDDDNIEPGHPIGFRANEE